MNKPLAFNLQLALQKPRTIDDSKKYCPFCDVDHLEGVLAKDGDCIWITNKFPVLADTWPTVIIESANCDGEFSTLPLDECAHILDFSLARWQECIDSGKFASVLYFKNSGPFSGGSIHHPHSQIMGLTNYDYRDDVKPSNFTGTDIYADDDVNLWLAEDPLIGFFEFSIRTPRTVDRRKLAHLLQQVVAYVLRTLAKRSQSYNLFFYDLEDEYLYIKVVPRTVISPLFVGYSIAQVMDEVTAKDIAEELGAVLRGETVDSAMEMY